MPSAECREKKVEILLKVIQIVESVHKIMFSNRKLRSTKSQCWPQQLRQIFFCFLPFLLFSFSLNQKLSSLSATLIFKIFELCLNEKQTNKRKRRNRKIEKQNSFWLQVARQKYIFIKVFYCLCCPGLNFAVNCVVVSMIITQYRHSANFLSIIRSYAGQNSQCFKTYLLHINIYNVYFNLGE